MGKKLLILGICLILLAHPSFVLGFGGKPVKPPETSPYRIEAATDKNTYSLGEKIEMSIMFTNTSPEAMSSYYPSSQRFDFIVTDANSREVWRWSHGKMFLMVITPFKLKSGERMSYKYTWDQKDNSGENIPAGAYYVTGRFMASPKVSSQKIRVNIIKREKTRNK